MRAAVCAMDFSTRPTRAASGRTPLTDRPPTRRSWKGTASSGMIIVRGRRGARMPEAIRRANTAKSKRRSRVEHVFAEQKDRMGLFIRTIGIARAKTKIGLANLVYNIKRLLFLHQTPALPAAHSRRNDR